MTADYMTARFGEILKLDDLQAKSQGIESLLLRSRLLSIVGDYILPDSSRNSFSLKGKKGYKLYLPVRHISKHQERQINTVIKIFVQHQLLWHLLLSRQVYMRDKIREFCEKYEINHENNIENIERIIKCRKKLWSTDTAI